jgi:hypothetical protein
LVVAAAAAAVPSLELVLLFERVLEQLLELVLVRMLVLVPVPMSMLALVLVLALVPVEVLHLLE